VLRSTPTKAPGNHQADDGVGQRESQRDATGADQHGQRGESVGAGVQSIGNQSGRAAAASRDAAQTGVSIPSPRSSLLLQDPYNSSSAWPVGGGCESSIPASGGAWMGARGGDMRSQDGNSGISPNWTIEGVRPCESN
jgi:hypothetical protein